MSHKFAVGQRVAYIGSPLEGYEAAGRYTITQLMPEDAGDYQYHVRRETNGAIRRVREALIRPLPTTNVSQQTPRSKRHTAANQRLVRAAR
jgi:hypothetical protein